MSATEPTGCSTMRCPTLDDGLQDLPITQSSARLEPERRHLPPRQHVVLRRPYRAATGMPGALGPLRRDAAGRGRSAITPWSADVRLSGRPSSQRLARAVAMTRNGPHTSVIVVRATAITQVTCYRRWMTPETSSPPPSGCVPGSRWSDSHRTVIVFNSVMAGMAFVGRAGAVNAVHARCDAQQRAPSHRYASGCRSGPPQCGCHSADTW